MKSKHSQKTTIPLKFDPKWLLIDVKGKNLGDAATCISDILRGKNKPYFTPQLDCGDNVVVINAKDILLTAKKLDKKMYFWHTKYPGGIHSRSAREVLERKPWKLLSDAIYGMLPKNRLRNKFMKKLHIYIDEKHTHDAQKLKPFILK